MEAPAKIFGLYLCDSKLWEDQNGSFEKYLFAWMPENWVTVLLLAGESPSDVVTLPIAPDCVSDVLETLSRTNWGALLKLTLANSQVVDVDIEDDWICKKPIHESET